MKQKNSTISKKKVSIHTMAVVAILSAIAYILMFMEFSVPLMPGFIKMDLSDLPALIGTFATGPVGGILIALIKNLLHLTVTSTAGVGELSNFILNVIFILPAGLLYKYKKTKASACGGAVLGAVAMALVSVVSNYFIVYPVYYNFMPEDTILAAYQAIFPGVDSILQSLIVFNMPFTFVKAMISVVVTVLIYKRLVPVLQMSRQKVSG
ncbi:Riboflavin ECF transporter S component RibU [uncultured Roseburia sp.]|uniref:Riboflavin transporter n=1 Tax=Brotonthovivens ammoniilytica TaxID=2981725 RepID=A0ABT2TK97_9FIRM|nr:ECF transporter S component [Brotonthovivens ammoniilytica]MCU6762639.1 ECF transporter S component [Brotonthovivens ammoniilytica]SCI78289.1 Riboflavin ECF transporter S component RibU [uncultured Roseburia sp.]